MDRTISRENEKHAVYFHCFWYQKQWVQSLVGYKLRCYVIAEGYILYINVYRLEGRNKILTFLEKNIKNVKWLVKRGGWNPISHVHTWHTLEGHSTKMNFSWGLISSGRKRSLSRDSLKRLLIWVLCIWNVCSEVGIGRLATGKRESPSGLLPCACRQPLGRFLLASISKIMHIECSSWCLCQSLYSLLCISSGIVFKVCK